MLSDSARRHQAIIEAFLFDHKDALVFQRRYLDEFLGIRLGQMECTEYEILNNVFWAVEDFVAAPALRDSPDDLDEDQLRAAAEGALVALRALDAGTTPETRE